MMPTTISATRPSPAATAAAAPVTAPDPKELEIREKFQDFVAGTFYKTMLKALRSGQKKPAYVYGGQAEEVFQGQMDQIVAEQLARTHGAQFADPLFDSYANSLPRR